MKFSRLIVRFLVAFFFFLPVFISCTKEEPGTDYSYYVSKELALQFTKEDINSQIDLAVILYPEISDIKLLIVSDIDVYKLVYKTNIDGQEINASGLVCVPSVPGDYPVLSFQNGTNTYNADSPSESPSEYSYKLIEFIASMGYVVVIADYPGFGESVQIPHPYLITGPTVQSLVDMLFAVKELAGSELPGITLKDEYYLLGYSQGGWATLALHKKLEQDYDDEFSLGGSACGAGPYNISLLMDGMINTTTYPMPVYLGYIYNAYSNYSQFDNPVTDIFNEPYAGRIGSLYSGQLTSDQINSQLTTSITELINPDFLSGFSASPEYASVREAFITNSISAWHTYKPLLLIHGENDTHVNPVMTEYLYTAMIQAGTSEDICKKTIIPGVDHGAGVVPGMVQGILFLNNLNNSD